MRWVILGPTEPFVVLNQGQGYLEGYLAKKPQEECEALEANLERIQCELKHPKAVVKDLLVAVRWEGRWTRGVVVSAAGFFVDVFLLDYGVRECFSKTKLYVLPEDYQKLQAYGMRIELEDPLEDNLRDTTVLATYLRRLSPTLARGSVKVGASDKVNGIELCTTSLEADSEPCRTETTALPNGIKGPKAVIKPPNDLLLEMIGTRCLLTQLLVKRVKSPVELWCSHFHSLAVVREALDSMNEIPSRVPHEEVAPNMLVMVVWRATFHRGIVGAIFTDPEPAYRVEFIDLPGHIESSILYYAPSNIAQCAPRALMRVRLKKHVHDINTGDVITLLCESVVDNTAYGDLVEGENQTTAIKLSRLEI